MFLLTCVQVLMELVITSDRPKRRCTSTEMSKKGDEKDDHEEEHVKEDVPCSSTSKPAGIIIYSFSFTRTSKLVLTDR